MKLKLDLVLVTLLELLLAIGAIVGGYSMINDPTGVSMFKQDLRKYIIVPDFLLPGLFLFVGFGLCTFIFLIALWMNFRVGWVGAMLISVAELVWILVQIILLYEVGFIIWQLIIPAIAVVMIIFLTYNKNREFYFTNAKLILPKYNI